MDSTQAGERSPSLALATIHEDARSHPLARALVSCEQNEIPFLQSTQAPDIHA